MATWMAWGLNPCCASNADACQYGRMLCTDYCPCTRCNLSTCLLQVCWWVQSARKRASTAAAAHPAGPLDAQLDKLSEADMWNQIVRLIEAARYKQGELPLSPFSQHKPVMMGMRMMWKLGPLLVCILC